MMFVRGAGLRVTVVCPHGGSLKFETSSLLTFETEETPYRYFKNSKDLRKQVNRIQEIRCPNHAR
jgi:hypothetical protein